MSGTITHSWNGTVLTVTSDSGTSSADLKGDIGIRGPQGEPGVVDTSKVYTFENPPTAAEVGARDNNWLPTIAEIGAAPSGYGLGVSSLDTPFIDTPAKLDAIGVNRWFIFTGGANNPLTIDGESITYGSGRTDTYNDNNVKMTFMVYAPSHLKTANAEYCRFKVDGVWGEWKKCGIKDFAPSGYGLGEHIAMTVRDVNTATRKGWFLVEPNATNSPNSTYYVVVRTDGVDGNSLVQTAFVLDSYFSKLVRRKKFGTWGEWEWENPPMTVGVEYRTTERWDGQTVFCKLVECGRMPNATTKSVDIGAGTTCKIIRCKGRMVGGTNYLSLPFKVDSTHEASCHGQNQNIVLYANYDLSSSYNAYIAVWYTKD